MAYIISTIKGGGNMNKPNTVLVEMGKRITERRKLQGLSQEELAEKADLTPQTISTAERGVKAIRPENLLNLSKALGVSADYLLTGEIIDKDICLIANSLNDKTPEQIRLIEQIINNCSELCHK